MSLDGLPFCTSADIDIAATRNGAEPAPSGETVQLRFTIAAASDEPCRLPHEYSLEITDAHGLEVLTFGSTGSCFETDCSRLDPANPRDLSYVWDRTGRRFTEQGEAKVVAAAPGAYMANLSLAVGEPEKIDENQALPAMEKVKTVDLAIVSES